MSDTELFYNLHTFLFTVSDVRIAFEGNVIVNEDVESGTVDFCGEITELPLGGLQTDVTVNLTQFGEAKTGL